MSEYNNNVPNPDWYVRGESETLPDKEILATLDETKRRLLRVQTIGLRNLKDKKFFLEYPNNTIYDIVNTIGLIPITNGSSVKLPPTKAGVKNLPVCASGLAWVTSWGTVYPTSAGVRNLSVGSNNNGTDCPCYIKFSTAGAAEERQVSIPSIEGDSIFAVVWYKVHSTDTGEVLPFTYPLDWSVVKLSESLVDGDYSSRVLVLKKNSQATGEEEVFSLVNGVNANTLNFCIFDVWNHTRSLIFIGENSGSGTQTISKGEIGEYFWILRAIESQSSEYSVTPDSIYKQRFFNQAIKNNMIIYDRDKEAGKRNFTFGDTNATYSYLALKLEEEM